MTKYNVGDRVEVTIVADVISVSREPDDKHEYLRLDNHVFLWTGSENVNLRKIAPPKPEVGEVIDGARLKATPWKRGTVVLDSDAVTDQQAGVLMLTASGDWVDEAFEPLPFDDDYFDDEDVFTVVYLP